MKTILEEKFFKKHNIVGHIYSWYKDSQGIPYPDLGADTSLQSQSHDRGETNLRLYCEQLFY